jgi:hypothetical protein
MDEFINRMDAQRSILNVVNEKFTLTEELCGLSKRAIDRWLNQNKIDRKSTICSILFEVSSKLYFLANKSQEQITEEYKNISNDIVSLRQRIINIK